VIPVSLFAGADVSSVDDGIARVRAAADDGFGAIWFPQTSSIDAITLLAVAAREVPQIALGTSVVPIQGRHPIPLAQAALTWADAAGPGRVTLGLGAAHTHTSEGWYGIPYRTVVSWVEEELEVLASLFSDDRTAAFEGSHLTARVKLAISTPAPRLLLAALGPKMLALAGRFTDGTVTWNTGVRTLARDVVPTLVSVAERSNKPAPCVIAGMQVCVTNSPDERRDAMNAGFSVQRYASYARMLAAEGARGVGDIALIGSEEAVTEQIAAVADAGATELLAIVVGDPDEQDRTRQFLGGLGHATP
jgi:F420-dependent oxidoreductase-like protein